MTGTVYLVGAGPGDPGLITVRGLELVRRADVLVFDRLVSDELVREAPPWAELASVGKRPGCHPWPQEEITALLVERARRGLEVVRLKGGDPFVFGRGGEEVLALAAAGVAFEVVPGVSSAIAGPAAAGIPVTHRGVASSFAVVNGHGAATGDAAAWAEQATGADTLVILMGVAELRAIARVLAARGRALSTPVAVIRAATTPEQDVIIGTLGDIADRAASIEPPAVIVVGPVVDLATHLAPQRHEALAS